MDFKKQIPNLFTLLNLFSGCVALIFVTKNDFYMAFLFVCVGIFFDFFDGFFARQLNVQSELGLQLDSLADMVTSGLVPGFVMYKMLFSSFQNYELVAYISLFGFVITLASCYRLAKFNIDTRQTDSFIGLPTPANALFILSLPLVVSNTNIEMVKDALTNPFVLVIITMVSAVMLNAEIPLFSLKIKNFTFQKYKIHVVFLVLSTILLLVFKHLGFPLIILLYVILSLIQNTLLDKKPL